MKKLTAFLALALVLALSVAAQAGNKLEERSSSAGPWWPA